MGSRAGSTSRSPSPSPSDLISALPSKLLHKILCRLPLDDAVRTSALSSRWRHLWSTNPVLHLTDHDFFSHRIDPKTYAQAISSCCNAYSGETLNSFSFFLSDEWPDEWPDVDELFDSLLLFAAGRKVEELSVMACVDHYNNVEPPNFIETPPSIFRCSSLHTLSLVGCSLSCFPSLKDDEKPSEAMALLPALTSLELCDVGVDGDQFSSLLASCPLLETLGLLNCVGLHRFVIESPKLEKFYVFYDHATYGFEPISIKVVNAPNLKWLGLKSDISLTWSLSAATNLAEVTLFGRMKEGDDYSKFRKLLWGIPRQVEILAVNGWFLEPIMDDAFIPLPRVFLNLKELHITVAELNKMALVSLVSKLGQFVLLEKLVVHMLFEGKRLGLACIDADLGVNCAIPSLKKFSLLDFSATDEEMKLVELLMNKGAVLEYVYLCSQKRVPNSNLLEAKINSFSRASRRLAHIIWLKDCCYFWSSRWGWGHAMREGQIFG